MRLIDGLPGCAVRIDGHRGVAVDEGISCVSGNLGVRGHAPAALNCPIVVNVAFPFEYGADDSDRRARCLEMAALKSGHRQRMARVGTQTNVDQALALVIHPSASAPWCCQARYITDRAPVGRGTCRNPMI
jgi:hypothetical protein